MSDKPMTVSDLRAVLASMPDDLPVIVYGGGDYRQPAPTTAEFVASTADGALTVKVKAVVL